MKDEIEFTLKSTLTEEQINLITDAEFEHTDRIWFYTPRGKHVEFVKAQQWIPCSERLPKPVAPSQRREWFVTSNQYGGVTLTCYEFEASPFKEGWQTDMSILAWMPLPEPYAAEREET